MLLRRPQTPTSWRQPNPQFPDASLSPLSPKRWLGKDAGAVGLGIVAALENSIIRDSLAKSILTTAPVAIPSARPAGRRIDECGRHQLKNSRYQRDGGFFCGSPSTACNEEIMVPGCLRDCCMCRKRLHGKEIYMYMEKAFCSVECRYQQILSDEEHKRCKKMSKISCSPCSGGGSMFFTGVAVA